ncbi:MAG: hypothetical protein F4Y03_17970 [Alphaproteobacteria bacterium]|nr:hypothetical protein [Alphaproteobacteria bacterium]
MSGETLADVARDVAAHLTRIADAAPWTDDDRLHVGYTLARIAGRLRDAAQCEATEPEAESWRKHPVLGALGPSLDGLDAEAARLRDDVRAFRVRLGLPADPPAPEADR